MTELARREKLLCCSLLVSLRVPLIELSRDYSLPYRATITAATDFLKFNPDNTRAGWAYYYGDKVRSIVITESVQLCQHHNFKD